MAILWVVGEPGPEHGLARISAETATMARELAGAAGLSVVGLVVAAEPAEPAAELATYLPSVLAIQDPAAVELAWSAVAAAQVAALAATGAPDAIFVGAGPDGRDLAGALSALTGLGVLTNATGVTWGDAGPSVEMSVFGGKLLTTSGFTGGRGIVTVRPNVTIAAPAANAGKIEDRPAAGTPLPAVRVLERISEAGAAAPIEEARIIVSGGRGSAVRRASTWYDSSRRPSTGPSARPVRPSIPAGSHTANRSGRPARSSSRSSISRSGSVARSSTRWACRRRARSSP